jgi:hypothetical protein
MSGCFSQEDIMTSTSALAPIRRWKTRAHPARLILFWFVLPFRTLWRVMVSLTRVVAAAHVLAYVAPFSAPAPRPAVRSDAPEEGRDPGW